MSSKKLFTPAFDITLFRQPNAVNQSSTHARPSPAAPVAPPKAAPSVAVAAPTSTCQTPVSCFITTPPDESAGVKLPSPSRITTTTADVSNTSATRSLLDDKSFLSEKKSKKDKKDRKKKRKASEDLSEDDDILTHLLKSEEEKKAEVIKFAAERGLTVSFEPSAAAAATRPVLHAFGAYAHTSHPPPPPPPALDVGYETYMAGPGNYVNAEVKRAHAQEVAAMTTDGKSLGDKKYGCTFCGAIHHLDCHTKGNDPPCMKSGAFNRFVQNFLFEFDIAPEQEWRNMLQYKVSGYRRAMAERFAAIIGSTTSDADWTATLQRRAWDMRKQAYSSNAGTSRELYQQGRVGEFLFFHNAQGASSTSPRPSSTLTLPSPVPMMTPFDFHHQMTTF